MTSAILGAVGFLAGWVGMALFKRFVWKRLHKWA